MSALFPKTHKITVSNEKGGVGKSTSVVSIAHRFTQLGVRVLLVDMDKQRDTTRTALPPDLRDDPEATEKLHTVSDILLANIPADSIMLNVDDLSDTPRFDNRLYLIPAHEHQHQAERELLRSNTVQAVLKCIEDGIEYDDATARQMEQVLELELYRRFQQLISTVDGKVDLVIFDTPGNPGLLANLAMAASNWVLSLVRPSGYDIQGIGDLVRTIDHVRQLINPHLKLSGCVLNGVKERSHNTVHWKEQIQAAFNGESQYTAVIPHSVRLEESATQWATIFELDPKKSGTKALQEAYSELVDVMYETGVEQIRKQARQMAKSYNENERLERVAN